MMKEKTLNSMIEEIVSQMKKDDLLARKLFQFIQALIIG